jgi:D-alanine-D-alanine ligase-like ATP-grasp enzyme
MLMAEPAPAVRAIACGAVAALGLRLGAVDLFTDLDGAPGAIAVIEVNANPAIRFLEDSGRDDLILAIWRHSFLAMGLL